MIKYFELEFWEQLFEKVVDWFTAEILPSSPKSSIRVFGIDFSAVPMHRGIVTNPVKSTLAFDEQGKYIYFTAKKESLNGLGGAGYSNTYRVSISGGTAAGIHTGFGNIRRGENGLLLVADEGYPVIYAIKTVGDGFVLYTHNIKDKPTDTKVFTGTLSPQPFAWYDNSNRDTERTLSRTLGKKQYELKDHLGNIRAVITDLKKAEITDDGMVYSAEVTGYNNYYPFGMLMPGFNYNAGQYRFGFNGKEMDNDFSNNATGSIYDYGFRIYDPRIGKFLSVDPLTGDYPWYTPYQFAGNKPIWKIDLDGLEEAPSENDKYSLMPSSPDYSSSDYWNTVITGDQSSENTSVQNSTQNQSTPKLPSNGNKVFISPSTHDGKFTIMNVGPDFLGSGWSDKIISSDKDAVTGFWETTVNTEFTFSQGFSPSVALCEYNKGKIKFSKSYYASSLADMANQAGLITIASGGVLGNYSKFTGQDRNRSGEEYFTASGIGWVIGVDLSFAFGGNRSLNTFQNADFYYTAGNETVLGLTTIDSIIRATFDTLLYGRTDFLEKHKLSEEDLDEIKKKYNSFTQTY